mgnify:CR=1 FL=1
MGVGLLNETKIDFPVLIKKKKKKWAKKWYFRSVYTSSQGTSVTCWTKKKTFERVILTETCFWNRLVNFWVLDTWHGSLEKWVHESKVFYPLFSSFLPPFSLCLLFFYTWKSENGRNFENVQDKFHPTETKEVKNQWIQGERLQQSLGYFIILSEFFTRSACHLKVLCRKRIKNTKKGVKIYEMTYKKRENLKKFLIQKRNRFRILKYHQ